MLWSDVKNFTYAELKFFTWKELNSSTIELYKQYRTSTLPSSITAKLLELSQEVIKDNPELALTVNNKKQLTTSDFITIISFIISMPTFFEQNKAMINDLIAQFMSFISK